MDTFFKGINKKPLKNLIMGESNLETIKHDWYYVNNRGEMLSILGNLDIYYGEYFGSFSYPLWIHIKYKKVENTTVWADVRTIDYLKNRYNNLVVKSVNYSTNSFNDFKYHYEIFDENKEDIREIKDMNDENRKRAKRIKDLIDYNNRDINEIVEKYNKKIQDETAELIKKNEDLNKKLLLLEQAIKENNKIKKNINIENQDLEKILCLKGVV